MKSIKKLLTLALASALLFTACSSGGTTQTSEEKKDDKKTEQSCNLFDCCDLPKRLRCFIRVLRHF